jgi:hypothetical protein
LFRGAGFPFIGTGQRHPGAAGDEHCVQVVDRP